MCLADPVEDVVFKEGGELSRSTWCACPNCQPEPDIGLRPEQQQLDFTTPLDKRNAFNYTTQTKPSSEDSANLTDTCRQTTQHRRT